MFPKQRLCVRKLPDKHMLSCWLLWMGGDGNNFTRECVPNGQTRENSWARTVCRNGTWKASLNGWGCTNGFNCDSGTCQIIGGIGFCRDSNMVDPGYTKSCANGETCPSGTSCNNTMCCPPGTCGWGGWPTFNNVCIANGGYAENVWARLFCSNGTWKVPLYGWGCAGDFQCAQGSCRDLGGGHKYCVDHLPIPSSASSTIYNTYNAPMGTCRSCASQGFNCGTTSDNCGGVIYCGSCSANQACINNVCSCLPNCSGKACGADNGCGSPCLTGNCSIGYTCVNGQCVTNCTNVCTSGTSQCNGTTGYQTCGDYNGDGCTEWGAVIACDINQTCQMAIVLFPAFLMRNRSAISAICIGTIPAAIKKR